MNYVVHWHREINESARVARWPQDYVGLCGTSGDIGNPSAFLLGGQGLLGVTCPDCIATVPFRAEVERRCADQMEWVADQEHSLRNSRARLVALRALRRASGPYADPGRWAEMVTAREKFLTEDAANDARREARRRRVS